MDLDRRKIIGFFSVFIVILGVYLYTIAPTVSLWDCGEFIACSHILGVPHPPGTPFFVVLGRIFDIIFPFKEVAKRINLLSSLSTAIACGFLYLVILRVLNRFRENRGKRLPLSTHLIAVFSSIGAGFCYSIWDTSVETEVYATSILITILCLWLALNWDEHRGERGDNNVLLLLVYLIFLSFGIHLLPLLLIPGVLVFVLMADAKVFKDPKFIAMSIFLVFIGVTTYLYLMVRAHANPPINETDPTTWGRLMDVITREQYGPMKMLPRKTQIKTNLALIPAFFEQVRVFFKYFSWQFFPYPRELTRSLVLRYLSITGTYIYLLIGLWGMFVHFRRDRKSFWLFFILYILLSFGLVIYLNLKFSPSDLNPAHQEREVRERDYFWTPAFFLFMFYVSIGLYWIYEWVKNRSSKYSFAVLILAGLVGILPAISNIKSHVNRRGNWIAHDYAHNLLMTPRPYSVLFTYGDNDTFPVWFLQYVKNFRRFDPENKTGIQLANFSLMNTQWYIKQLKWAGVPLDFASPFLGTQYEGRYRMEKREGRTNLDFEEWVIENLFPMRGADGSIIFLKDMTVRNIIVSALGKRPTLNDLLMPIDSFVAKYIDTDEFNPSINIYFSFPMEPDARRKFGDHLVMEGFAFRLVREKGEERIEKDIMWDQFLNEYKYSYVENFGIPTGPAQDKVLSNHSYLLYIFGNIVLREFMGSRENLSDLSIAEKDTLEMLTTILKRAFIMARRPELSVIIMRDLKDLYALSDKSEEGLDLSEWLLGREKSQVFQLFKGEMLILVAEESLNKEEKLSRLKEAERVYNGLSLYEEMKPLVYIGLIQIYSLSNEEEKIKDIADIIMDKPEVLGHVLSYLMRYDTTNALLLLNHWKKSFPGDPRLNELIERLE